MRLIDADALIARVESDIKAIEDIEPQMAMGAIGVLNTIKKAPTASAVVRGMPPVEPKRPKGEWIDDDKIQHKYHRCSECGLGRFNWGEDNFCPNCGADMRGDKK